VEWLQDNPSLRPLHPISSTILTRVRAEHGAQARQIVTPPTPPPQGHYSLVKSPVALGSSSMIFAGPMYIYIELIN
jgi:hypothetical protein